MTRTVDDLRNEIRLAVGRFERESTPFTKESLAALSGALGAGVDGDRLPPTARMRADILRAVGALDEDTDAVDRTFRKAELEAIVAALDGPDAPGSRGHQP